MQSSVNFPSVNGESDAYQEPDQTDTNVSLVLRSSTLVRSVPVWHKDYVMWSSCIADSSTVELLTSCSSFHLYQRNLIKTAK